MPLEFGFHIAPNWRKLEKWQWRYNLLAWHHRQIFLKLFCFSAQFSYWSKFPVNNITGSGVTTIYFYKRLTRNPEIINTSVWVFPMIWRVGQVRDTKFGADNSSEMLLYAAKYHGCSFYRLWVIKGKPIGSWR